MHRLTSSPASAPRAKRTLDAVDYDTIETLFTEIPESPMSTDEELRWNSCLRDTLKKFRFNFNRG